MHNEQQKKLQSPDSYVLCTRYQQMEPQDKGKI